MTSFRKTDTITYKHRIILTGMKGVLIMENRMNSRTIPFLNRVPIWTVIKVSIPILMISFFFTHPGAIKSLLMVILTVVLFLLLIYFAWKFFLYVVFPIFFFIGVYALLTGEIVSYVNGLFEFFTYVFFR